MTSAKKPAAKKPAAKKPAAKKPAAKKPAAKKPAAKKPAAKRKPVAKKQPAKRSASRSSPATVTAIVQALRAFYADHCPRMLAREHAITPATAADLAALEATLGAPLPPDLRELLQAADFRVRIEGNFEALDRTGIESSWGIMTTHLRQGTFKGWVEKRRIVENNPGIREGELQKCWWSEGWIPFAEDSCGNLKCVDTRPGPNGTAGQVVAMETQDGLGPSFTGARSLRDYLMEQLGFLRSGKYTVTDEGFLEIDRYL